MQGPHPFTEHRYCSTVQWVGTYIRARERVPSKHNILSGWRSAGLMPLRPVTVLAKLLDNSTPAASPPHTPAQQIDLDLSLLDSSPPECTELRQACRDLLSPTKRFMQRTTRAPEIARSGNIILKQQVKVQAELLHAQKARRKGNVSSTRENAPC